MKHQFDGNEAAVNSLWNSIHDNVVQLKTTNCFNRKYNDFLLNNDTAALCSPHWQIASSFRPVAMAAILWHRISHYSCH